METRSLVNNGTLKLTSSGVGFSADFEADEEQDTKDNNNTSVNQL